MDARVRITYEPVGETAVRCRIDVIDSTLIGHAAELRITRKAVVKKDRPVHASDTLLRRRIDRLDMRTIVDLPRDEFQAFTYDGRNIDIEIHSELKVDDGFLFDTKLTGESEVAFGARPPARSANGVVDPHDEFDLVENLKALSMGGRLAVTALMLVGAVVIAFNLLLGIHDQSVPPSEVWWYSQSTLNGKSSSPFLKSLFGSGIAGGLVWWAIRRQLRRYMKFELHGLPERIRRSDEIPMQSIVRGQSGVPLRDVVVRVVACNVEKGQHVTGSGKRRRTRTFREPVRAVVLYEKRIAHIPANEPVERYLDGRVAFEPMFRSLYPPQRVSRHHALEVHWEVQLLHDEYVDQEVAGPVHCFGWREFLNA